MAIAPCGSFFSSAQARRRWRSALLWLTLAGPWIALGAADHPLEIIELRARLPEDLIPLVRPLAGPDGTVIGAEHALFVRASPARLADIRRAIAALDRPAQSLLIQVRQGGRASSEGAGAAARIDQDIGDGTRLRVGPGSPNGAQAVVRAGRSQRNLDLTQEVRALDGHPAHIAVGRDVLLPPSGWQGSTLVREESGFYVIPRVLGDQVTIEIATRLDAVARAQGASQAETQGLIRGRLGDWIPIASSRTTDQMQGAGLLYGAQGQRATDLTVEVRVLTVD